MIDYLSSNELNIEKYDRCISKAINSRIYAYSWYLNIVCDAWGVLVKDDYQAVMPLPHRKKFGISYVYLPPWTQQLGIFSAQELKEQTIKSFVASIPKKFKLIDTFLNSHNSISSIGIDQRQNYILDLNNPYEMLRKQFSKGRKSNIKQAENHGLEIIEKYDHNKIIELFESTKGEKVITNNHDYTILSELMTRTLPVNLAKSLVVLNNKKELIGGAIFLQDGHRITYLFSAVNKEGRDKQAMSFLLNEMIRINSESDFILDFEGSMIKELATFFKSFGSETETYFHLKRYRL